MQQQPVAEKDEPRGSRHLIRAGKDYVPLPAGVTLAEWNVERQHWQNPRIRSLLGSTKLLEEVFESNYAILHCSPDRLTEIQRKTRQIATTLKEELAPLLENTSAVPQLEEALVAARTSLRVLQATVLQDLEALSHVPTDEEILELRKLLCVVTGKLHAFLQDNFVRIVSGDPRSQHDTDYFLSKRFANDIEEAEWLHYSVSGLADYLETLEAPRRKLTDIVGRVCRDEMVPSGERWLELGRFLGKLTNELTPKLRAVLSLRGIRFDEMESLDQYASDIPASCRVLEELGAAAKRSVDGLKTSAPKARPEREQSIRDMMRLHADFAGRIAELLGELDRTLRGLLVFVPFWLHSLEGRRALILRRVPASDDPGSGEVEEHQDP